MNLFGRIWNMIGFGSLGPVNDGGPVQTAQVSVGYLEVQDRRPVVGLFGFASNPPTGSDVVLLYQAGDRSKGIIIGVNHQTSRPTGQQPGETTVFNNFDMSIAMTQNGIIINSGGKPVHLVGSDLRVDGDVIAGYGGADQVGLQTHTHPGDGSPPTPGT